MIILPDKMVVVLDIETTDVALSEAAGDFPRPVEIGACLIDAECTIHAEFSELIRPEPLALFTDYSQSFTGIDRAELNKALSWTEMWRDFAKFTKFNQYRLLSYGALFDYPVLRAAYARSKQGWPHAYPMVDILSIAYRVAGEYGFVIPRWSLNSCCERFGIEVEGKHRALGGARRAVAVLHALSTLEEEEMDLT